MVGDEFTKNEALIYFMLKTNEVVSLSQMVKVISEGVGKPVERASVNISVIYLGFKIGRYGEYIHRYTIRGGQSNKGTESYFQLFKYNGRKTND
jgi:hypothetical protein